MVTLIHDHMTVFADAIVDNTLAENALNQSDIQQTAWLSPPTADSPNRIDRDIQEL